MTAHDPDLSKRLNDEFEAAVAKKLNSPRIDFDLSDDDMEVPTPPRQFGKPWTFIHPTQIEPRAWLYAKHYIRRFVTATIASGGVGKTSLTLAEAICMASGRGYLGIVPECRVKVFFHNGEDPREEIERKIAAICLQFNIDRKSLEGWLHVSIGLEEPLHIATAGKYGVKVDQGFVDSFTTFLVDEDIGVVIIDPFVSCHQVPENDNNAIDAVAKAWGRIAQKASCSIELVHHVRKGQGGAVEAEDARGAKALIDAVRSARVLNQMTEEEGLKAGVEDFEAYFNVSNGKANLTRRSSKRTWYQLVSQDLGNPRYGRASDDMGVVAPWDWPAPKKLAGDDVARILEAVKALGKDTQLTRQSEQSTSWIGYVIGPIVGLNPNEKAGRVSLKTLISRLVSDGYLITENRLDQRGKSVPFLTISTTSKNEVEKGGDGGEQ